MSDEAEYIEPTQEHVGQVVEVEDAGRWVRRKLLAVLPSPQEYRFICESIVDTDEFSKWKFARIARQLTYAERQAKCGLKVGDRVRVMTLPEAGQDGWKCGTSGGMRHLVGTVHRIEYADTEYGFTVDGHSLPYFVLEKVEDRVATRDDIGKQVYINGAFGDVFTIDVIFGVEGDLWRAVIRSGDKRFVYELSNLRVKE